MRIDIVTAIPELFEGPLSASIVGKARDAGFADLRVVNLRDFAEGRHRQIDDYAFGGGAGMVLKPEPLFRCVESLRAEGPEVDEVIFLSPDAPRFTQGTANELSLAGRLVLIAGHYKGIDQRVRDHLVTRELSIGDYVLSGGELPALVLVDAIVRLIPGVLGDSASALDDSFQDGLLGAPVYTRPASFREMEVPDVLTSGDHAAIRAWQEEARERRTREIRPDLLDD